MAVKRYAQPPQFDWRPILDRRCKVADWWGWLARIRRDPWERGPHGSRRYRRRGRLLIAEGWGHYHRERDRLKRDQRFIMWSKVHPGKGRPKLKPAST